MTITFYLKTIKTDPSRKKIYGRVTLNSIRKEFATEYTIIPEKFKNGVAIGRKNKDINDYIIDKKKKGRDFHKKLLEEDNPVSAQIIRDFLIGKIQKNNNQKIFDIFYSEQKYIKNNTKWTLGRYTRAFKYFNECFPSMDFKKLKHRHATEFMIYLKQRKPLKKSDKMIGHNMAVKYVTSMSSMFISGVKNELLQGNTWANFSAAVIKPKLVYLTADELSAIERTIVPGRFVDIKKIFLFQCYTGFEYSRVKNLRWDMLSIRINGKTWVHTSRDKTDENANLPLIPRALKIIDGIRKVGTNVFHLIANNNYNDGLRVIIGLAGIDKPITSHKARHTFATTICLDEGISPSVGSNMMGITEKTFIETYGRITPKRIDSEMQVHFDKKIG